MSRPISESLSLLSETLGNCKTNLKEKEVADVDNIKISDVDEKIAEIKSGGGGNEFHFIENVELGGKTINSSSVYNHWTMGDNTFYGTLKFTPKEDINFYFDSEGNVSGNGLFGGEQTSLKKGTEYTITFNGSTSTATFVFVKNHMSDGELNSESDIIVVTMPAY